ncbi:YebC/PmpR family DNA-binding transcriptional regulator [Candidatus Parcubacteria bacterium]|nr:YebC/PmpR family DNA-binding transcriptional regulator [Candidatus Parcubacteria bacterium]
MSGHSKWSTIKRKKGATDAKRGAIFTKLGKLIAVAVKEKGGDPDTNFTLRMAIDKARAANMPKDTIERAIKRGTGELEGDQIVELIYEGIGPANSQFIVKALTDNKNRSAASIRHTFTKYGGSLGSVMWNFEQKGVFRIANDEFKIINDEDELELIEAGADDIIRLEEGVTLFTKPEYLQKVKKYLEEKDITAESAEIEYVAKDEVDVSDEDKEKIEKFIEELEDNEDVADYYTNVNI